ncbi:MAG: hypothetical protein U0572_16330 [Phycisphaerales bacterium]
MSATAQPIGTFSIRVNGGAVHTVQCFASASEEAGCVRFQGATVDPAGTWEASWDYVADLDPNGTAKLVGSATMTNKTGSALDFDAAFDVPLCPFIQSGAKMGGSCAVKITTNENGGAISTAGGSQVFGALADDSITAKLFHGPFNMGSTGAGVAQTMNSFGAPVPNYNVGAITSDFGVRHIFKLTDGDVATLTSTIVVGGDPADFVACGSSVGATPAPNGGVPVAASAQADGRAPAAAPPIAQPAAPPPTSSTVTLGDDGSNKRITISAGPSGAKSVRKPVPPARKPPVVNDGRRPAANDAQRSRTPPRRK